MKLITEYIDYRAYIRDFYLSEKEHGFSWGAFAEKAGISSPVFLQYISENKKNLSEKSAPQVAYAMGLVGIDVEYFVLLVSLGNAKNEKAKKLALDKIAEFSRKNKVRILGAEEYEFFKSWKNSLIREIAPALSGATPKEISKATYKRISTQEVKEILSFLTQAGFLRQNESGGYVQTHRSLKMSSMDLPRKKEGAHRKKENAVSVSLEKQMAELAIDALSKEEFDRQNFSGLTLGISCENYRQINDEIMRFRHRVKSIVMSSPKTEEVYRLNVQFFPLSNMNFDERDKRKNLNGEIRKKV